MWQGSRACAVKDGWGLENLGSRVSGVQVSEVKDSQGQGWVGLRVAGVQVAVVQGIWLRDMTDIGKAS